MLADDMIRMPEAGEAWRAGLRRSQRFFLSPKVVDTCRDLSRSASTVASWRFLFTPAIDTFLEWHAPDVTGPLAQRACWMVGGGEGSVKTGGGFLVRRHSLTEIRADEFLYLFDNHYVFCAKNGSALEDDVRKSLDFVLAVLALLNTPRLIKSTPADLSKLNAIRAKKRRELLLEYRTVELDMNAPRHSSSQDDREPQAKTRLHHVRSHLRLKRARVEIVRPHWRGDPALGVLLKQRVLTSSEGVTP